MNRSAGVQDETGEEKERRDPSSRICEPQASIQFSEPSIKLRVSQPRAGAGTVSVEGTQVPEICISQVNSL